MADRGKKCTEIMDTTEENTAHQYPEGDRQPAEHGRADRPRDGSRAGDG